MRSVAVSAPGKLVISGEYVVLEGAPALVVAVDRRAIAQLRSRGGADGSPPPGHGSPDRASIPEEAAASFAKAQEICGPVPLDLAIDTRALRADERKLGLGSSAAAAAAAAGAVFAYHGHDLDDVREPVLAAALAGHGAVAPEGSGIDVAAAVMGGLLRFVRDGDDVSTSRLEMPRSMAFAVVWTGTPARTSDLVRAVRELGARDADAYGRAMAGLRTASGSLLDAIAKDDAERAIAATAEHAEAMARLGRAAGAPIVDSRLTRVAEHARAHGGAAKPSGAGGGDVAIAVFPGQAVPEGFETACTRDGMRLLDVALGAEGVRAERH